MSNTAEIDFTHIFEKEGRELTGNELYRDAHLRKRMYERAIDQLNRLYDELCFPPDEHGSTEEMSVPLVDGPLEEWFGPLQHTLQSALDRAERDIEWVESAEEEGPGPLSEHYEFNDNPWTQ